ncbi:MAG: FAD-dependent monooxygenase [Balneolaceae bacterium]|nr:FAD-dependent monooxygenase [Balneolaceae bacterium]
MKNDDAYQVAIAGGGPVGLFLGCLLQEKGISCIVLEKRKNTITHSRSIGIHPVSLELFESIGLADDFIEKGTKVKEGMAFINSEHIGTLSFASCPPPYPFVLTLPQYITEELLVAHLNNLNSAALQCETTVTGLTKTEDSIQLNVNKNEIDKKITAQYVVGADGINSRIRQEAAIAFKEKTYDDSYIMGDFSDNTGWGSKAAIFLCDDGLIESFPLSGNMRRWVVKTQQYMPEVHREDLETLVSQRIGHQLHHTKNIMLSSFGVQKGLAETMSKDRVLLAGDAAHIVSPIGGQGMNLGWLDARDLANCFEQIFNESTKPEQILNDYSKRRLKIAGKAIRRAEFNMALGRKTGNLQLKKSILWLMLKTPISSLMARIFTMRGLQTLPF